MKFICYVFIVILVSVDSRDVCPVGEVAVSCKSPCQPSCLKPSPGLGPDCKTCEPGCVCRRNLLRDTETGSCVPPRECPKRITCEGENMELIPCVSKCPRTCQTPCRNTTVCFQLCEVRCDCKSGFIWDEISSKCIEPFKCSRCKCPENELWTQCNGECEKTCHSIKNPQTCEPSNSCTPGCICPKGFIRNEEFGKCIPINKCPL